MSKVKIISNPYIKEITYQSWNEVKNMWETITYENKPDSDLVSTKLKKVYLPLAKKQIIETIVDDYYDQASDLELYFSGTKDEYNDLKIFCENSTFKCNIIFNDIQKYLKDGQEVYEKLFLMYKRLNLNIPSFDSANYIYQNCMEMKDVILEMEKTTSEELNEVESKIDDLEKEKDDKLNYLSIMFNAENKLTKDFIRNYEIDLDSFISMNNNYYIFNENRLKEKHKEYQKINEEKHSLPSRENEIKDGLNDVKDVIIRGINKIKNKNEEEKGKAVKDIGVGIFKGAKDLVVGVADITKEKVKIQTETNDNFIKDVRDVYHSAINEIGEKIISEVCKLLISKETANKKELANIIIAKSILTDAQKEDLKQKIMSFNETREINIDVDCTEKTVFELGLIQVTGFADYKHLSEKTNKELKETIYNIFNNVKNKSLNILNDWQSSIINEITKNLSEYDPDIKEKINLFNDLFHKKQTLKKAYRDLVSCKDEINDLIEWKDI